MTRNAPRGPKRSPTPTSATFHPAEPHPPNPVFPAPVSRPLYLASPFVEATLVKGQFKTIVMLPKYVDIMEWVAVNSTGPHTYSLSSGLMLDTSVRLLHQHKRILWRYC